MLLSNLGIFKSLIKILLLMVKTMVRLVQLIGMFMKNHASCVRNISTCSRCPMYHRIDSRRERDCHAHRDDYAVLIALPTFLLATLLCVLFIPCVWSVRSRITLEWYDTCVSETENHPEAWWYNTAFEYYNVNLRALLSFSTCSNGYSLRTYFVSRETGV
jgi:hypothetical protein